MKEFQQDLALEPRNSAAEYEMGEIYRRRGQFDPAREHLSRALKIDLNVEDEQIALARTLIHLQKPKESLSHLLAAIQLNPRNAVSHFLLAGAYKSLGDSARYQHEMALYRKYHFQPYTDKSAGADEVPSPLANPEVTKQALDSEAPQQPWR
jgi:predicted Zn-dependent protease